MLIVQIEAAEEFKLSPEEVECVYRMENEGYHFVVVGRVANAVLDVFRDDRLQFCGAENGQPATMEETIRKIEWDCNLKEDDLTLVAGAAVSFGVKQKEVSDWPSVLHFEDRVIGLARDAAEEHGAEVVIVVRRTPDVVVYHLSR